ncbi:MAG: methionine--tRNA ligase [Planctomycetota bacterium]
MADDRFYVTTPIYYVNDIPHIGHSYTTIAADVLARYHRLCGRRVHFLTGTDEHGIKIQRAAAAHNETPIQLADRVVERSQSLWKRLDITHDDFIRTTEPRHERVVQHIFDRLHEKGDLYPGQYEGWYCASCENFLADDELVEGDCPDCGKEAEWASEETYYFKMSSYEDRLLAHLAEHPEFVRPEARFNEVRSRVEQGLRDVSVTRTSITWGVPLPFDEKHVIYVWIDALINYVSALGYPDGDLFESFWPADVHLIGKDIIWFHCVIWPCVLMALDVPLPRTVFAHGWWTHDGEKMSKSKGNFVDPVATTEAYGVDPYRYFLLRSMPFGQDGDFSESALVSRYNNDLGNDLGNLLHRTLTMIEKYRDGVVPEFGAEHAGSPELQARTSERLGEYHAHMGDVEFSRALEAVWEIIRLGNQYVEERKPWELAKDPEKSGALNSVLRTLASTLGTVSVALTPFMPHKMSDFRRQLGLPAEPPPFDDQMVWTDEVKGKVVAKGEPLFPRIEEETE